MDGRTYPFKGSIQTVRTASRETFNIDAEGIVGEDDSQSLADGVAGYTALLLASKLNLTPVIFSLRCHSCSARSRSLAHGNTPVGC